MATVDFLSFSTGRASSCTTPGFEPAIAPFTRGQLKEAGEDEIEILIVHAPLEDRATPVSLPS
jgi:hypothetical protein